MLVLSVIIILFILIQCIILQITFGLLPFMNYRKTHSTVDITYRTRVSDRKIYSCNRYSICELKKRFERAELAAGTVHNCVKCVRLLLEMNDVFTELEENIKYPSQSK